MTWANGRQLTRVRGDSSFEVNYTYDGDGLRTSKSGARNTEYIILGGTYIGERTTINGTEYLITYIYDANGSILGIDINGTAYYFVKNLQGDVTAMVTEFGEIIGKYTYDAYGYCYPVKDASGNTITDETHPAMLNPFRYRGYYYDVETKFYYLTTRYYDPEACRFINADGLTTTGVGFDGNNMFAYCNNNPIMFVDPTGNYLIYYDVLLSYARKFLSGQCDWVYGTSIKNMKDSLLIKQAQAGNVDPSVLFEQGILTIGCRFVGEPVMPVFGGQFKDNDYYHYIGYPDSEHYARDITGNLGSYVFAAFGGVVVDSETHWSYGTNIVIETTINGEKYRVIYAHLTEGSIKWDVGRYVNAGDIIGTIGMTGNTDGPHVHVEMRKGDFNYIKDNLDIESFF